mgnify:CR=1 FL=1
MRNYILIFIMAFTLTGCAGTVENVKSWVPSFWDDQQSERIVDIRLAARRIHCDSPEIGAQVQTLRDHIDWFLLYSESKGWQQNDVVRLVEPMSETVEGFEERIAGGKFSPAYCAIKLGILQTQTDTAAEAVLGRY